MMPMTRTFRQPDLLSDPERLAVFGAAPDPFGVEHLGLRWRAKDVHFLLDLEGSPVCHVSVLQHAVRAGTWDVKLAGIGEVITATHAQGRGCATALLRHAIQFAYDHWRVEAVLLFCSRRMVPFYERLGFRELSQPVLIEQPWGRVPSPIPVMVSPADRLSGFEGALELGSAPW
jgi:GNAT superfamily N-acetyltransferase